MRRTENFSNKGAHQVEQILDEAKSFEGTPYRYGGLNRDGIDCSGLVFLSFKSAGITLPRSTIDQVGAGKEISVRFVRKGDLLFFRTDKSSNRISHVGLVTKVVPEKEVFFIHSSNTGVREDNLYSTYYQKTFALAVRVID